MLQKDNIQNESRELLGGLGEGGLPEGGKGNKLTKKNRVLINKRRYAINCDAAKARFMDGVFFICAVFVCKYNTITTMATAS